MSTKRERDAATVVEYGCERLAALARPLGFGDQLPSMLQLFRDLIHPWGGIALGQPPPWPSDVCDDHTPFEFSIAVGGAQPELRMLVESRGDPPTLESNQHWGLAINALLRERYGVALDRVEDVRDLFLPPRPEGVFAVWHAVSFWPGRAAEFKLYLNLAAQGQERAPRLAEEAMRRLGFGGAWPAIAAHLLGRGPERDRLMYFSLDLSRSAAARVKLYVRHFAATGAVLEHVCAAAPGLQPGSVEEFCRALAGADGPFLQKAPVTCAAFVEDDVERPSTTTIYFPVAAYAPNDRVARDRIAGYLAQHALPLDAYTTPLDAFATRRLGDGAGMQSYASLRCGCARPRVTVYFSPEVFSGAEARARAAAAVPAGDLLEEHRRHPITDHPYFARLGQAPEAGQLWALQSNLQHAIVDPEPRRLSALTARVDDDRLRCLLVQHLNEVLGNGDFARARRRRFAQLLEAAGCRSADDAALASGRSLGRALDYYYVEAEVAEALGANLVVELYARQVESFLGVAERPAVSQVDTLARLLPPSGPALEAAWRGGRAIADAWRKFLDALPESAAA